MVGRGSSEVAVGTIPEFPELAGLGLEHREQIGKHLRRHPPQISELTFTNLLIWADTYRPELCWWREWLCVLLRPQYRAPFFLPPVGEGDPEPVCAELLAWLATGGQGASIERVSAPMAGALAAPGRAFRVTPDRDNSDYLYRREGLATLAGRKYHAKRTNINKLESSHRWEYRELTPELVGACRELQEQWCELKGCDAGGPALQGEHLAVMRLLDHYPELGVRGGVVMVEGRVAAFTAGEQLNANTAVVHVEKADPILPGLYQVINREFARSWAPLEYLNREQDMGDPGLRRAKESYFPHHMVDKYIVQAA